MSREFDFDRMLCLISGKIRPLRLGRILFVSGNLWHLFRLSYNSANTPLCRSPRRSPAARFRLPLRPTSACFAAVCWSGRRRILIRSIVITDGDRPRQRRRPRTILRSAGRNHFFISLVRRQSTVWTVNLLSRSSIAVNNWLFLQINKIKRNAKELRQSSNRMKDLFY